MRFRLQLGLATFSTEGHSYNHLTDRTVPPYIKTLDRQRRIVARHVMESIIAGLHKPVLEPSEYFRATKYEARHNGFNATVVVYPAKNSHIADIKVYNGAVQFFYTVTAIKGV